MSLTALEVEALAHVMERIEKDGAHTVTGCPRFCRAMCPYTRIIRAMEARGVRMPT